MKTKDLDLKKYINKANLTCVDFLKHKSVFVFAAPFCLELYQEILQSSNGALVWTFLKPLLHGKILYNSNISMIDLVIEKVSIKRNTVSVY